MAETTIYAEAEEGGGRAASAASWSGLFAITSTYGEFDDNPTPPVEISGDDYSMNQIAYLFDTSELGAGATISDIALEITVDEWGGGGWDGIGAGAAEGYVFNWQNGDPEDAFLSVALAQSLYTSGAFAGVSPAFAGEMAAADARHALFTGAGANFGASINPTGYTGIILAPSNWRTETQANQRVNNVCSPFHTNPLYLPRLYIEYTEGEPPSGGAIPVIMHHLKQQGIS